MYITDQTMQKKDFGIAYIYIVITVTADELHSRTFAVILISSCSLHFFNIVATGLCSSSIFRLVGIIHKGSDALDRKL